MQKALVMNSSLSHCERVCGGSSKIDFTYKVQMNSAACKTTDSYHSHFNLKIHDMIIKQKLWLSNAYYNLTVCGLLAARPLNRSALCQRRWPVWVTSRGSSVWMLQGWFSRSHLTPSHPPTHPSVTNRATALLTCNVRLNGIFLFL